MASQLANLVANPTAIPLVLLCFLGGASRLTHGRLWPAFYGFQVARAPNDASTWYIPALDLSLGTALLFEAARPWAAGLCLLLQGVGVGMRLEHGEGVAADLGLCSVAVVALLGSLPVFGA
jgi:hypothetical protein